MAGCGLDKERRGYRMLPLGWGTGGGSPVDPALGRRFCLDLVHNRRPAGWQCDDLRGSSGQDMSVIVSVMTGGSVMACARVLHLRS